MKTLARSDWFEFLCHLGPGGLDKDPRKSDVAGGEMIPLVPLHPAEDLQSVSNVSVIELPLDWWVHVGGPIRAELEVKLQRALLNATELCLELKMKPDPVLTFEIEAWFVGVLRPFLLESRTSNPLRVTFSSALKDKKAWSEGVSVFSEMSWKPLPKTLDEDRDRAEFWLEPLGLDQLPQSSGFFETFVNEMLGASVDSNEPPWIFWSRFPAWWSHWDRRQPNRPKSVVETAGQKAATLFGIDSRLTFLRCSLSPQDEVVENESLETGEIMLNPTFETVERPVLSSPTQFPLLAFSRSKNAVAVRTINSLEAFLVDGVRESFRIHEQSLVGKVSSESQVAPEFVRKAIHQLVLAGIFLKR